MDMQTMIHRAIFHLNQAVLHAAEAGFLLDQGILVSASTETTEALIAMETGESFLREFYAEMGELLLEADLKRIEQAQAANEKDWLAE